MNDQVLEDAKNIIRAAIRKNQQCFSWDIDNENKSNIPHDVIMCASREMQESNEIRLKEDAHEHAMEYLFR